MMRANVLKNLDNFFWLFSEGVKQDVLLSTIKLKCVEIWRWHNQSDLLKKTMQEKYVNFLILRNFYFPRDGMK